MNIGTLSTSHLPTYGQSWQRPLSITSPVTINLDRKTAAATATATATASILLAVGSHSLLGKLFLDGQTRPEYILLVNA